MKQALLLLLSLCLLISCQSGKRNSESSTEVRDSVDLPQIKKRGELVVLTINSSTSYFNYRGEPMGYQYELATQFAASLGLKARFVLAKDEVSMVRMLNEGKGDLIAYNLGITPQRKDSLIFCGEEYRSQQVIVQRTGRKKLLTDVTQLIGKEVYVYPGRYLTRMQNLQQEIGGGIIIHEVSPDSVSMDDLMEQVSQGVIDYAVTNSELAMINRTYYPNLDMSLEISFDQRSSWAVRRDSPQLAVAVDAWQKKNSNSPQVRATMNRYYLRSKTVAHSPILSMTRGVISRYDPLFKKYAPQIEWDWRTLASLAYTESNFDPTVVSWAGARGLMQLMPRTAHAMGVPVGMESDPEHSVKAAVKYIAYLQKMFGHVSDRGERIKFVLAAYNAGAGHVTDAIRLTRKYGKNDQLWDDNVAHYLLLKSNPEFYQDPVCRNGYFRGAETLDFVSDVLTRTAVYRKKILHSSH